MDTDFDTIKFIEAVRSRPSLWDKFDPMHRTLEVTNSLWSAVAEEMGVDFTGSDLKQKWHNLRDCFRREVRMEKVGKKKKKWLYYYQMLFLLSPQNKNSSKDDINDSEMNDNILLSSKVDTPDETYQCILGNVDSDQSENTSPESTIEITQEKNKREKKRLTQEHCQSELLKNAVISASQEFKPSLEHWRLPKENLPTKSSYIFPREEFSKNLRVPEDDDYHFAMSIIPHMRQIPMYRKLRMRIRISEIIAEELDSHATPS